MRLDVGHRVRRLSAWGLSAAFAFAAFAALFTVAGFQDIEAARMAITRGEPSNPVAAGALLDLARLAASGAALLALLGSFGTLVWFGGYDRGTRHVGFALPAILVGAVLLYPILLEYTGGIYPADPLAKVPVLLATGAGVLGLAWRSRASLLPAVGGTMALVAGAAHAKAYGPWWSHPTGAMHPLALEGLWAAAGFALLAIALALHARALQRATSLSARSTVATDMPV